jgi:HEAT repeat protein
MLKNRLYLSLVALLFITGALILAQHLLSPAPVYNGRSLDSWLDQYYGLTTKPLNSQTETKLRNESEHAIYMIGTNAIPHLMAGLKREDSGLSSRLARLVNRLPLLKIHMKTASESQRTAVKGFQALGPKGEFATSELEKLFYETADSEVAKAVFYILSNFGNESAIPVLVRISQKSSPEMKKQAMILLGYRRSATNGVLPVLLHGLHDHDPGVRWGAAFALGKFSDQSDSVVPALVETLYDVDSLVQGIAAQSLGGFGEKAKMAIPALVEIVKLHGPTTAAAGPITPAANALYLIDPAEAIKAGVPERRKSISFE